MTAVRRATLADAPELHALAADTFPLACPPGTAPAAIAQFVATQLSEERFRGYLADPARELFVAAGFAGYTMLVYAEPADADVQAAITARPSVELSKCYVRPEHHGGGVAAALISASIASAQRRGAAGMWLGVQRDNARANAFYAKQGFAWVGDRSFHVGEERHDDFTRERVF
jgi:ribosomal protein S18 acetylase RimI-like enzyme